MYIWLHILFKLPCLEFACFWQQDGNSDAGQNMEEKHFVDGIPLSMFWWKKWIAKLQILGCRLQWRILRDKYQWYLFLIDAFHTRVTFIFMASRLYDLLASATTNCSVSNAASTNLHRPISNLKSQWLIIIACYKVCL